MTVPEPRPLLADWGERFHCYTAALATWIARSEGHGESDGESNGASDGESHWWRPLLDDGPELGVTRQPSGTWRFDHSSRPWLQQLGLGVRSASDWPEAKAGLAADLEHGPVILAGNIFALPWQLEHGSRHAPHWVTLYQDGADPAELVADDPLILVNEAGSQQPYRGVFKLEDLAGIGAALPAGNEIHWLRERSVIGAQDPAEGAAYRWFAAGRAVADPRYDDPGRLVGPDALAALADDLDARGAESSVLQQADDLWQALRQREFAAAVAEQDPIFVGTGAGVGADAALAGQRLEALEVWRDLPVLLHHARIRAATGNPRATNGVAEALRELAELEPRVTRERV
jgi:hypothetical protein